MPRRRPAHEKRETPIVLVADDERAIADGFRMILTSVGYHAITAYRMEQAVHVLNYVTPAAVINNQIFPDGMGPALCDAIRANQRTKDIVVALLSGQAFVPDLSIFDICWPKPTHPEVILRDLKRLLAEKAKRIRDTKEFNPADTPVCVKL